LLIQTVESHPEWFWHHGGWITDRTHGGGEEESYRGLAANVDSSVMGMRDKAIRKRSRRHWTHFANGNSHKETALGSQINAADAAPSQTRRGWNWCNQGLRKISPSTQCGVHLGDPENRRVAQGKGSDGNETIQRKQNTRERIVTLEKEVGLRVRVRERPYVDSQYKHIICRSQ
jgi:hypothetical protein